LLSAARFLLPRRQKGLVLSCRLCLALETLALLLALLSGGGLALLVCLLLFLADLL
jgi:hypothetical protein